MNKILKQSSFLLMVAIMVISCKKGEEGILSPAEMVQVMEELYLAEEKVNQLALHRDSAKQVARWVDAKVFSEAAVSDTVFRKSLDYYMAHPRQLEQIYTALVDTLQLREQRAPFSANQQ